MRAKEREKATVLKCSWLTPWECNPYVSVSSDAGKEKILPAKKRLFLFSCSLALVQQPTQKERYSVEKNKVRVERKLKRIKTKAKGAVENNIQIRDLIEE